MIFTSKCLWSLQCKLTGTETHHDPDAISHLWANLSKPAHGNFLISANCNCGKGLPHLQITHESLFIHIYKMESAPLWVSVFQSIFTKCPVKILEFHTCLLITIFNRHYYISFFNINGFLLNIILSLNY